MRIVPAQFISTGNEWRQFLLKGTPDTERTEISMSARTGRPLGKKDFIIDIERKLNRKLQRKKPGPKRKCNDKR